VPDPSVVQGAILAGIPVACEPARPLAGLVADGARVTVTVDGETATIGIG
jgi:predicted aconitase with swiveling domain